mmetsp:Transcript_26996/g.64033  ORF Transcript_26996/g.64033 Transcript_26996/m.64033 type:complete len:234 (-) Transcript_26996:202-903(-)
MASKIFRNVLMLSKTCHKATPTSCLLGNTTLRDSKTFPFACRAFNSAEETDAAGFQDGKGGANVPLAKKDDRQNGIFEYTGPFHSAVKRVKVLSVTSLGMTLAGAPMLVYLQGDAAMTLAAKAGLACTLCGFGALTTGLLQWFASPYVCCLRHDKTTGMIDVKTLSFFAQERWNRFHVNEVSPTASFSPVSTFDARGKTFYVDPDHFQDLDLLAKLTSVPDAEKIDDSAPEGR